MKKIIILLTLQLIVVSAFSQTGTAEFSFENKVIKFPKVNADTILNFTYRFTNSGTAPLIISDIKAGCSCTSIEFSDKPILPGKESVIKVSFDTKNKFGYQDRTLIITSNARKTTETLRFKGVVNEQK
jgi:hypothetical protein